MSTYDSESETNMIEVEDLVVKYGDTTAVDGINFNLRVGEHLTLLGPSGCGKTTTLRAIAGLEEPSSGKITINGETVFSSDQKINIPTENRGLAMVFQSYAIWPHMTVAQNVGYGLKVKSLPRAEIDAGLNWALELVEMESFRDRSAANLSGGQQQRVALARALAVRPSVVLLDEPLSNLDARLRAGMRREMQQLQKQIGVSSLYVTHDQEEALVLSDRIIVMNAGRIAQIDTPDNLYRFPRTDFVADFVGAANVVSGQLKPELTNDSQVVIETPGGNLIHAENQGVTTENSMKVAFRPAFAHLASSPDKKSLNNWLAKIKQRVFLGEAYEYSLTWEGNQIVIKGSIDTPYSEGEDVYIIADPKHCVVLDPNG